MIDELAILAFCGEAETRLLYPARSAHVSGLGLIVFTSVPPMLALRAHRHCSPAKFRQILQRVSPAQLVSTLLFFPLPSSLEARYIFLLFLLN